MVLGAVWAMTDGRAEQANPPEQGAGAPTYIRTDSNVISTAPTKPDGTPMPASK